MMALYSLQRSEGKDKGMLESFIIIQSRDDKMWTMVEKSG
jgi:hypothetical protein